jgi:hypothetical protein
MSKIDEIMKKHIDPDEKRFIINATVYSKDDAREIEKLLNTVLGKVSKISRLKVMQKLG